MESSRRRDNLLDAVYAGDVASVRWLINQPGTEVDARTTQGNSPIGVAIDAGRFELTALLIEAGASPRQQNHLGIDLMDRAVMAGAPRLVALLADRGLVVDTAAAVVMDDVATLRTSLGAFPMRPCLHQRGWSLLHLAARARARHAARQLLDHYANVDARDLDGATPLHHCLEGPRGTGGDFARLLSRRGADMSAQDEKGQTALHRAVTSRDRVLLPLLLALGSDPDVRDGAGRTAADLARSMRIKWAKTVLAEG